MGECRYCGQSAGLFRKVHDECEKKYLHGLAEMEEIATKFVLEGNDYQLLPGKLTEIAKNSFIDPSQSNEFIVKGWENAVDKFLDDGILTETEQTKLDDYQNYFKLTQEMLDKEGYYQKVIKNGILQQVLEGKIPDRINIKGMNPFNFQKGEILVWAFQDVSYYEQKTKRQFSGSYGGFSIKVAKGLYYRTGAFKGHPVETTDMVYMDTGILGITNKHLYYSSSIKNFRVKYDKIVTFMPFEDGIGIQKDTANAKPQVFKNNDGWFTYNLVTNLAKL